MKIHSYLVTSASDTSIQFHVRPGVKGEASRTAVKWDRSQWAASVTLAVCFPKSAKRLPELCWVTSHDVPSGKQT